MESNIQVAVAIGLIKDKQGRILLQKRTDTVVPTADGKWEFPGGHIEYKESPGEAVKRECLEEIGCEVKVIKMLPLVQSSVWMRSDNREQHVLVLCYELEIINGTPRPSDKKVAEVKWFLKEEIKTLNTLRGISEFIDLVN